MSRSGDWLIVIAFGAIMACVLLANAVPDVKEIAQTPAILRPTLPPRSVDIGLPSDHVYFGDEEEGISVTFFSLFLIFLGGCFLIGLVAWFFHGTGSSCAGNFWAMVGIIILIGGIVLLFLISTGLE